MLDDIDINEDVDFNIETFNIEIDKAVESIKKHEPKQVLLQLPDGLKPKALELIDILEKKFPNIEFYIWTGSCFGACDLPIANAESYNIDLIIHFGHLPFMR